MRQMFLCQITSYWDKIYNVDGNYESASRSPAKGYHNPAKRCPTGAKRCPAQAAYSFNPTVEYSTEGEK